MEKIIDTSPHIFFAFFADPPHILFVYFFNSTTPSGSQTEYSIPFEFLRGGRLETKTKNVWGAFGKKIKCMGGVGQKMWGGIGEKNKMWGAGVREIFQSAPH